MASIGDTIHHDPSLRPSVHARRDADTRDLLSDVLVAPFHEHTPIRTLPQEPSSHGTQTGLGVSGCGNAVRDTSIPYAQSY